MNVMKRIFKNHFSAAMKSLLGIVGLFSCAYLYSGVESKEKAWNWKYRDENGFESISFDISAFERRKGKWDVIWSNTFRHTFSEKIKEYDVSIVFKDKIFYLKMGLVKEWPMGNLDGVDIASLIFADVGGKGIETAEGYIIAYRPLEKNKAILKTEEMDFYVIIKIKQGKRQKSTGGENNKENIIKESPSSQEHTESIIQNELKYIKSKTFVLGKFLREKYPESHVLVILDSNYCQSPNRQMSLEGLKEGLGGIPFIIDTLKLVPLPNNGEILPLEKLMTAEEFDLAVNRHPECNLMISLIGFPGNIDKMQLWKMDSKRRPRIALAEDVYRLRKYIEEGFIVALLCCNPEVNLYKACPEKSEEAFKDRYLIITPENINDMEKKYPVLFERKGESKTDK